MEKLVIKKYLSIEQIKDCFKYFENYSYPFQNYIVLKYISSLRFRLKNIIRSKFKILNHYIFYVIYNSDNLPVMIAPLQRDTACRTDIEVLGSELIEYVDVIYNPTQESVVRSAFDLLFSELKKEGFEKLYFKYTPENSSYKILKENKNFYLTRSIEKAAVSFDSWDKYFSGLSRKKRQVYNRLNRENKSFSFVTTKSKSLFNKCHKIYAKRQTSKYEAGFKQLVSYKYFRYVPQCESDDMSFTFALYIEKEVASFVTGFFDPARKAVELTRFAIDDKYSFYSPGIILLCETIKYLIANTEYRILDFCHGVAPYKLDMGGKVSYKHNFYVKL